MDWTIEPNDRIGPISRGMAIEEVIAALSNRFDTFKRVPEDQNTIFAFDGIGTHVEVGSDGQVCSVTVFSPNIVLLDGISLVGRRLAEVLPELEAGSCLFEKCDVGFFSRDCGVVLVDIDGFIDGVQLAFN